MYSAEASLPRSFALVYLRLMAEEFTLNFLYGGIPQQINCVLRVSTFTYQFLCEIEKNELVIERDDEGSLRVIRADPFANNNMKLDPGLVKALLAEMERVLH
jgi:hypothetical protein